MEPTKDSSVNFVVIVPVLVIAGLAVTVTTDLLRKPEYDFARRKG
jgi:hypothetical protein